MIYYAKVHKNKDGYWSEFPEFDTPGSEGQNLEELHQNSLEALEGILESLFDHKCEIPLPTVREGRGWLALNVDDSIAIPIIFRQLRLANNLTLKQMAKNLDIAYQSYQVLETPGKANPTIKTLRRIAEVFDITIIELLKDVA